MKKLNKTSWPAKPGVYLFKNSAGEVLYVGKAKNLQKRLRTYFAKGARLEPRTQLMLQQAEALDYITVSSETESLILENNLIKQYLPKYNVLLRDDKNYQFIKVDYTSEIPQVYAARKVQETDPKKAKYFGPYTSGLAVKKTLRLLRDVFHLCQNKKVTSKPCFRWHLKKCPGVCTGKISTAEYQNTVKQVEGFLRNEQREVLRRLEKEMKAAARAKKFEQAAGARDQIRSLKKIWERQKMVSPKKENQDYIGLYAAPAKAFINLFVVREGKLIRRESFELSHQKADNAEIVSEFISQYYLETSSIPKQIFVPVKLGQTRGLQKNLIRITKTRVRIICPKRGKKAKLVRLASQNAKHEWSKSKAAFEKQTNGSQALEDLAKKLKLTSVPERIEAYDISNIQGREPVGSMVVFKQGEPDKSQYRKFKIQSKQTPDDVAMMKEMLERRFADRHRTRSAKDEWPTPDLILIDGGKGQLNAVSSVLKDYKIDIPTIGLAKRLEELFVPGRKDPLVLKRDSKALLLLMRIRDEAHRFAITFHKTRRSVSLTASRLDEIKGVGPKNRQKLLKRFGSVAGVKQASLQAVAETVGVKTAKKINRSLKRSD